MYRSPTFDPSQTFLNRDELELLHSRALSVQRCVEGLRQCIDVDLHPKGAHVKDATDALHTIGLMVGGIEKLLAGEAEAA